MSDDRIRPGKSFITFLCCVLAMPTCTYLLPGIHAEEPMQAVAAGVLLGVAYLVIRPAMRLITLPLGCLTLGLTNLIIDIGLIMASDHFIAGFSVDSFLSAVLAAILVNAVCAIAGGFR